MNIKIQIEGDRIKSVSKKELVAGNLATYKLIFEFDNEWDNLIKLAIFNVGEMFISVPVENNEADIPQEAIKDAGAVYIGAIGIDEEENTNKRISVHPKLIDIKTGSFSDDMAEAETPELTVWDRYIRNINGLVNEARGFSSSARTSATNAESYARDARNYSNLAKNYTSPYIGENGNWFIWDNEKAEYVDSGNPSKGELGPQGEKGDKGERGEQGPQGEKGDGADVKVDSEMSDTSTNPVENKVVKKYVDNTLLSKLSLWQPHTKYEVGQIIIDIGEDISGVPIANFHICRVAHTSSSTGGFMEQWDVVKVYDSMWSEYAKKDEEGNLIHETYATKEQLGDIETALDSIIEIQNSLIGGDGI